MLPARQKKLALPTFARLAPDICFQYERSSRSQYGRNSHRHFYMFLGRTMLPHGSRSRRRPYLIALELELSPLPILNPELRCRHGIRSIDITQMTNTENK